ncbi:MAG: 30S ribosomal protein S18 [Candidatus Peregrinibacteria bacterium]
MNNTPKTSMAKVNKKCAFCSLGKKHIDYKNIGLLKQFGITFFSKIKPRKYTGVCLPHQKRMSTAIKQARFMALVPFIK